MVNSIVVDTSDGRTVLNRIIDSKIWMSIETSKGFAELRAVCLDDDEADKWKPYDNSEMNVIDYEGTFINDDTNCICAIKDGVSNYTVMVIQNTKFILNTEDGAVEMDDSNIVSRLEELGAVRVCSANIPNGTINSFILQDSLGNIMSITVNDIHGNPMMVHIGFDGKLKQ